MIFKFRFFSKLILLFCICLIASCGFKKKEDIKDDMVKSIPVNPDFFIKESLLEDIVKESRPIGGKEMECYVIKTKSVPAEHAMGPWCPRHIDDGPDKSGIWFHEGKVYDADGHFMANLVDFYKDDEWKVYREDGSIKVTVTQEACEGAAKPDVEEEYQNYCVECLPEYYKEKTTTYVIPVTPVYNERSSRFGRNGVGLAFNGVNFDPPAPTHAILGAHTVAPLDDHGGHVNPHGGYHYHAVTGSTKEIVQEDGHAPMIGYAIDGFGIYAHVNAKGEVASDLDACNGHFDDVRGYHYHAGDAGGNLVLGCLHGEPGSMRVSR